VNRSPLHAPATKAMTITTTVESERHMLGNPIDRGIIWADEMQITFS
jgi:hypothetical protein